jgi:hypothetical protein
MALTLAALRSDRHYFQENSWYSVLLEIGLEGLGELKNPTVTSGIETATFLIAV